MRFFATTDRDAFATKVINTLGYEVGIEVGVREGAFAHHLLTTTGMRLYGVDIAVLDTARALVTRFPGRYDLRQARSPEAADQFEDECFDFVYIDADHSYEAVAKDLAAWWPKLKPGGVFCGDDYAFVDNPVEGTYGVVEAVNEFADRLDLILHVVGCVDDREAQLAYARDNGDEATKFLKRQPHKQFQNPCWFIFKGVAE